MKELRELVGKVVLIRELNYFYATEEKGPEDFGYLGKVVQVSGNMIKLTDCRIAFETISRRHPGDIWFNMLASTFLSITISE